MIDIKFTDLTDAEILEQFAKRDLWPLEEMVLLAFGHAAADVPWDIIIDQNTFPARQYSTAMQATNNPNNKGFLPYFSKRTFSNDWVVCQVKKGPFLAWAANQAWKNEPRVQHVYKLWRKHKKLNGGFSPSLQTNEAKIKNYGDQLQIDLFKKHCESKSPASFKVTRTSLAKQAEKDLVNLKCKFETFRKYIRPMAFEELCKLSGVSFLNS